MENKASKAQIKIEQKLRKKNKPKKKKKKKDGRYVDPKSRMQKEDVAFIYI